MVEYCVDTVEIACLIRAVPINKWVFLQKPSLYNIIFTKYKTLPGDYCEEVIPDPIPNSEVKLFSADGTLP